ncbi:phage portal protein [uncultured Amaricoccus sp.]|uniref:phage portal protein n=1 Tax=uncultured Amaricoccus sp. TaxID=339341 RepID=UPI00261F6BDF|nr:phage portal protein [uncultured Amaricoccus sp.]
MKREPPTVTWGFMDRALATVSPTTAARRYAARVALGNLRRSYEGAQRGRGTEGWRASGTAADAEIAGAAPILRDRMRDLVRNNPMAARAVSVLVNSIVGPGIRPRAASGDPALNRKVDDLWKAWSARCDADGHTDFHGLLGLAVREMIEGGDVFAVRRQLRVIDALPVPLQIELKEADHLDAARFDNRPDGGRVSQGIEYDRDGRRRAYWLFPDHPGDQSPIFARRLEAVRVDAGAVAHLFERQRVQSRGVPWGVPAMRAIRDVDDWQSAELVRKKTEACLVGIVFGDDESQQSIAPVIEDAAGNRVEQFEPGLIAYARSGKDIKFNQPTSTAGVYEWHRVQLHIIAAGFRVPYELMTGDLSQVNFSSSRIGINEFKRMLDVVQWQIVIPMFCEKVWGWFIDAAFAAGLIPRGDIPADWAPPKFESVNPWQDAQTDLLETRAGFATLPQQIAKRGYDPKEVLAEWAEAAALLDELKLVLDSDPRKVTQAGLTQAAKVGQPAADADADGDK